MIDPTVTSTRPVADGLFTWPDPEPKLLGGSCTECGTVSFPPERTCVACQSGRVDVIELPRRGTLWTFTIQGFEPKPPYDAGDAAFEPYGVGYVELNGKVRVEARLLENDPDRLRIGMAMELRVVPFRTDADGTTVVTFAFAPVDDDEPQQETP